jgi:hypothetical protein
MVWQLPKGSSFTAKSLTEEVSRSFIGLPGFGYSLINAAALE